MQVKSQTIKKEDNKNALKMQLIRRRLLYLKFISDLYTQQNKYFKF